MIGVKILTEKRNTLIKRKQERLAEERRKKFEKDNSQESLQILGRDSKGSPATLLHSYSNAS